MKQVDKGNETISIESCQKRLAGTLNSVRAGRYNQSNKEVASGYSGSSNQFYLVRHTKKIYCMELIEYSEINHVKWMQAEE